MLLVPYWNFGSAWVAICSNVFVAAAIRRPKWVYSQERGSQSLALGGKCVEDKDCEGASVPASAHLAQALACWLFLEDGFRRSFGESADDPTGDACL